MSNDHYWSFALFYFAVHLSALCRSDAQMTAAIFNLRDYQSKKALKPQGFFAGLTPEQQAAALAYRGDENHGETLEQQAVSIINVALADHLDDTAPCELNPQDPA